MPRSALGAALAVSLVLCAVLACASRPAGWPEDLPAAAGVSPFTEVPTPDASSSASPGSTATAAPLPSATLAPVTPMPLPSATPTGLPTSTPTPVLLPTPDGVCRTLRVPILMYHYISRAPAGSDAVRTDLSLDPALFEEQLAWLAANHYQSVSLADLTLALQAGAPLPEKPVILTFDDGYADSYTAAFPLMRKYGFSATFFVVTSFLDENRPGYLTWDQVIEMHSAGMQFGSHTYTHPDLRGQSVEYLIWQILGSKEAIEARTGEPVRFFCYPVGLYDERTVEVLRSLQFWGAVVTAQGVEHSSADLYALRRVRVHGDYDAAALANAIAYVTNTSQGASPCTMTR